MDRLFYTPEKMGTLLLGIGMVFSGIAVLLYYLFALPELVKLVAEIVFVLSLVTYVFTHGGVKMLRRFTKAISLMFSRQPHVSSKPQPIQIAEFFYILDDPLEPDTFQDFLDDPIFSIPIGKGQQIENITPAQYVELLVFENIDEIHKKFGNEITVGVNLKRGSLIIALDFFLNAYDNIAKYNDAILGVMAFQSQIKWVIRKVSGAYRQRTERNIQIESNESVRRSPGNDDRHHQTNGSTNTPNPVSITNTVASPQPQKDMNLTLNINTSTNTTSGCISTIITFLLFLVIILILYYGLFELPDARQEALENLRAIISGLLYKASAYIHNLGDMLAP